MIRCWVEISVIFISKNIEMISYRIVSKICTRFFDILIEKMRFFDFLIENKSISMSISDRNYFDIDIDIDMVSYRIENFDIYIEI